MESEDAYLKLYDGLGDDALSVEPIFTEIETDGDWSSQDLQVLLSDTEVIRYRDEHDHDLFPTGIPFNLIKGLKRTEPILKTFSLKRTTDVSNTVHRPQDSLLKTAQKSLLRNASKDEIIQLANSDGNVQSKNSVVCMVNLLSDDENVKTGLTDKYLEEFYSNVTAKKCNLCSYLCMSATEMNLHLKEAHSHLFKPNIIRSEDGKSIMIKYIKMSSILNSNNKEDYTKKTFFLCSECNNGYCSKDQLKEHMISDHNLISESMVAERNVDVESKPKINCPKSLSTMLVKNQEKAMKRIRCSINGCTARFAKDELRQQHEECHVGENKRQFKCTKCHMKFSIWRICSNHMWKAHQIDFGLITCPICNTFKSNSSQRVITHMAIHNEEESFLCSECGQTFKQFLQLKNHQLCNHSLDDEQWSVMKKCNVCDRCFANSKCLKKHIQTVHEKFKPFICNICGHKAARKAMLELHIRQHTGQKPHQCQYCSYKTGDHNCLRKHVMRHNGEKKYSCPHCDYTSIQSTSFKSHILHKHPGKEGTFSCTYCSYVGINASAYASHVRCHELSKKDSSNSNKDDQELVANEEISKADSLSDEEDENFFLKSKQLVETVDEGGIAIPAELDSYIT